MQQLVRNSVILFVVCVALHAQQAPEHNGVDLKGPPLAPCNVAERKPNNYYDMTVTEDDEAAEEIWRDLQGTAIALKSLSKEHRRAKTVSLPFRFPFYGERLSNITIATGGFIYMGDFIHAWLSATMYIAPLMANFATNSTKYSHVRVRPNATSYTVLWQNVQLPTDPVDAIYSFSATLHKSGDIVFTYFNLMRPICELSAEHHPVRVGLSDAYATQEQPGRRTVREYDRLEVPLTDLRNSTLIYFRPLPTCQQHTDEEACCRQGASDAAAMKCNWCTTLKRCSTGWDRRRDDWARAGCPLDRTASSCVASGAKPKVRSYDYYNATTYAHVSQIKRTWDELGQLPIHDLLSHKPYYSANISLSFDFPIYWRNVRNLTILPGGVIQTGEYIISWEKSIQYIAPLMANFDTSLSNDSFIRMHDNGTAFTVVWENVALQNKPNYGKFTFSATLHKNGDIVFMYLSVPITIYLMHDHQYGVRVGLSDAYIIDTYHFFTKRTTIFEDYSVKLSGYEINNGTIVHLKALPSCLSYTDCEGCLKHSTELEPHCVWCPQLNRCVSHKKRLWMLKDCNGTFVGTVDQCGAASTTPATATETATAIATMATFPAPSTFRRATSIAHCLIAENRIELANSFYNTSICTDEQATNLLWESVQQEDANEPSPTRRHLGQAFTLKFDFPYFGEPTRNVRVLTSGSIVINDEDDPLLQVLQRVAPLHADFEPTTANSTPRVHIHDNGTALNVVWAKLQLRHNPEAGKFSFGASLQRNGDILFVYFNLPVALNKLWAMNEPIYSGLSDAYLIDDHFENEIGESSKMRASHAFNELELPLKALGNSAIVHMQALPACQGIKDCMTCVQHSMGQVPCTWCPALQRCSTGHDRQRQHWLEHGCEATSVNEVASCAIA